MSTPRTTTRRAIPAVVLVAAIVLGGCDDQVTTQYSLVLTPP